MPTTAVLCTDGSEVALQALAAGWSVVRPVDRAIVVSVIEDLDPVLAFDGGGHAGSTFSPDQLQAMQKRARAEGDVAVRAAVDALGIDGVAARILETRGRSRLKRALLGSVADYVIRNAPCPVVVTGETAASTA